MRAAVFFASLATLFASVPASPARAQSTSVDPAPAGYDHAIDQAVAEFAASRWAEARALFLQAHALYPNARTLRGIGMSSYELRDYPEAVRTLDEALTSTVRALTAEQRTQVTELRDRAAALVGRYEVPVAPAGARFYLDGQHVDVDGGWPTSTGHVILGVGEHQIAIRTDDGRSTNARVVVRGHTESVLDIDLAPLADHTPPATSTATPPTPPPTYTAVPAAPPSQSADVTPWVVMGVGLGVAVVGAILLGVGENDLSTVQNAPHGTPWSSLAGAYDRAPVLTGVGGAALGVGLAAAVVGIIWGVSQGGGASSHDEHMIVRVGPGNVSIEGTF
jgi:hypothetical protein